MIRHLMSRLNCSGAIKVKKASQVNAEKDNLKCPGQLSIALDQLRLSGAYDLKINHPEK